MQNPSRATTISLTICLTERYMIWPLVLWTRKTQEMHTMSTVSNSTVFGHWDNSLLWLLRTYLSRHGRYHSTTQQCCLLLSLWICLSWKHTPNILISIMSWKFTIFQYIGPLICGTLAPKLSVLYNFLVTITDPVPGVLSANANTVHHVMKIHFKIQMI